MKTSEDVSTGFFVMQLTGMRVSTEEANSGTPELWRCNLSYT